MACCQLVCDVGSGGEVLHSTVGGLQPEEVVGWKDDEEIVVVKMRFRQSRQPSAGGAGVISSLSPWVDGRKMAGTVYPAHHAAPLGLVPPSPAATTNGAAYDFHCARIQRPTPPALFHKTIVPGAGRLSWGLLPVVPTCLLHRRLVDRTHLFRWILVGSEYLGNPKFTYFKISTNWTTRRIQHCTAQFVALSGLN